ncbi:MAG: hypothetical protein AAGE94_17100 [Acidobacteriota bacterium]
MTSKHVLVPILLAMLLAAPVLATSVLHMNLDGLCDRADQIFRGVVVDIDKGTITAGGGELPTVTYTLEVTEDFVGNITEIKGKKIATVTMVGTPASLAEPVEVNGIRKFSTLPSPPDLQVGHDYLLLTTPKSAIGLSTTVGLGQGCFSINGEKASNQFQNEGLYEGPVAYDQLADDIRSALAQ